MTQLSEEMLNAYADGALDAEARAEVEATLRADPEARARLAQLRRADALANRAFSQPMREPPPRSLVDAILRHPAPAVTDGGAARSRVPRPPRSIRRHALPLAASLALVVGLAAGALLGHRSAQMSGELALGAVPGGSLLHRMLESHPSGSIGDGRDEPGSPNRIGVVATFIDRHARPCREVEVLPAGGDPHPLAAAVACRDAAGRWLLEGATRLAGAPATAGSRFEPSGVSERDALDGFLNLLGAQRALSHAEEKALIERDWKR